MKSAPVAQPELVNGAVTNSDNNIINGNQLIVTIGTTNYFFTPTELRKILKRYVFTEIEHLHYAIRML